MKNGVEQDIENIESFYDVEKNIYNIAKILKNQDANKIFKRDYLIISLLFID